MGLEGYRRKRDFRRTPEPPGEERGDRPGGDPLTPEPAQGHGGGVALAASPTLSFLRRAGRFVVHRHRARRLHYDLRLEVGGVLASWALPKGPTLDPAARRLAVRVEDHPLEYLGFEGVIPAGAYGAGEVMVWDWGIWWPDPAWHQADPRAALAAGELKVVLNGQRLRGRFALVRTAKGGGREHLVDEGGGEEPWLFLKKRDPWVVTGWDPEALETSVRTGRTSEEVRAGRPPHQVRPEPVAPGSLDLSAARPAPLPSFVPPMLAVPAAESFDDPGWLFEVKWDGYRVEAIVEDGRVRTRTRGGEDAATYVGRFLEPPFWFLAPAGVVDGEVVALDQEGRPDFGRLQEAVGRSGAGGTGLVFVAFDLLHLGDLSLLDVPLIVRKALLETLVLETATVRVSRHVVGAGRAMAAAARERGLEGVVAKRAASPYRPGARSPDWQKIKFRVDMEVVVGGWSPGRGAAATLGALAVGVHRGGRLAYVGKVGSGFDDATRAVLRRRLEALATDRQPFEPPPPSREAAGVRWVRPELVARVEVGGWTREGRLRQAVFRGLDLGRDPSTVVDEGEAASPGEPGRVRQRVGPSTAMDEGKALPPRAGGERADWMVDGDALAALAELHGNGVWRVGGRAIRLTNLDKVLFPPPPGDPTAPPITKGELIAFFARLAPTILPHLAGRPLTLHRFPDGIEGPGFWQKALPPQAPGWLNRWVSPPTGEGRAITYLVAEDAATLVWLANLAAFELHPSLARTTDPDHPTFAVVDIDPGETTTWEDLLVLGRLFRRALEHLGVRGYPKLTGKRGLHIWIPVVPRYRYAETSAWVEGVSRAVAAAVPDLVSWAWPKGARGGRARLDYTQNAPGRTLVAPYAVRPLPGAPVSAPIRWAELDDPTLTPRRWTVRTILERIAREGDLFAPAQTDLQDLPSLD